MSPPSAFGDADYDAIYATVAASERGRWFLDEYARRHRGADTDLVLAGMARIEAAVHAGREADARTSLSESVRHDLLAAADAISRTRQAIGYGATAIADDGVADALPRLIDEIDWRLHNLAESLLPAEVPGRGPAGKPPQAPADAALGLDDLTYSHEAAPSADKADDDPLADLTAAPVANTEASPAGDAMIEAAITDWAFADAEPPPDDLAAPLSSQAGAATASPGEWSAPPPARPAIDWAAAAATATPQPAEAPTQPHIAALERIEAREYGRHDDATQQLPELRIDDVVERPERLDRASIRAALDELIVIGPFASGRSDEARPAPPPAGDTGANAASDAGGMFDPDLFDADHKPASADASAPTEKSDSSPPGEPSPRDEASDSDHSSEESVPDRGDTPGQKSEVSERLEQMRKSIAALMDEIAQKTGRPVEPPES